ncbi:hypothetical protein FHT76_000764 [Rhizobium sp. BK176]|nr:hypothetical protein [Rhizobium sp. BK176]
MMDAVGFIIKDSVMRKDCLQSTGKSSQTMNYALRAGMVK